MVSKPKAAQLTTAKPDGGEEMFDADVDHPSLQQGGGSNVGLDGTMLGIQDICAVVHALK